MASVDEERQLWQDGPITCVMVSCCAGAELQIRRIDTMGSFDIILRELYPTKSDLYDRANELKRDFSKSISASF